MSLINHYSILWGGAFLFGLLAFFFRKDETKKKYLGIIAGISVVLLAVWFSMRAQSGSTEAASVLRQQIGQGQVVLLELQSPF